MGIRAQAPGKLILLGEYAVMEGAPALVAAINRTAEVTLLPARDNSFQLRAPVMCPDALPFQLNEKNSIQFTNPLSDELRNSLKFFTTTFEAGLEKLAPEESPEKWAVDIDTSGFYHGDYGKIGFGSSAALTVSLLGAIATSKSEHFYNDNDAQYSFFQHALKTHRFAQGKLGSGIDVAASCFGGILQYQINPDPTSHDAMIETMDYPEGLYILTIWTGVPASTRKLVRQVHKFRDRSPQGFQQLMTEMTDISFMGCHALMNSDIPAFLDAVQRYHGAMETLGQRSEAPIISKEHQDLASIARDCKVAYKPSGAGGGDLGIFFSDSPELLEDVALQVAETPYTIIQIDITANGLQTYHEKDA